MSYEYEFKLETWPLRLGYLLAKERNKIRECLFSTKRMAISFAKNVVNDLTESYKITQIPKISEEEEKPVEFSSEICPECGSVNCRFNIQEEKSEEEKKVSEIKEVNDSKKTELELFIEGDHAVLQLQSRFLVSQKNLTIPQMEELIDYLQEAISQLENPVFSKWKID